MCEQIQNRVKRTGGRLVVVATAALTATTGLVAVGSTATPSALAYSASAPIQRAEPPTTDPVVRSFDVPVAEPGSTSDRDGSRLVAELPATTTVDYGMVAVTWEHGTAPEGTEVHVKLRVDGDWTTWTELHVDADEGPSAREESSVRDGTSPLWVGAGTGVAVEVTAPEGAGTVPRDVRVEAIDPGSNPAATERVPSAGTASTRPTRFPAMPPILTRADWGADESLNDQCWRPIYGQSARMVFVHHTVNSNHYSESEGKQIVRSIHAYHTQSRGWCDIGYNFLIDKYGHIYQGRAGGMRRPVRGAHASAYNTNTVGVSLIGNFDEVKPSAKMKAALVRFIGWRLGTSYAPARGQVTVEGERFPRIAGHRDAEATACPGRYVYRWLPRLRDRVALYLSSYRSPIRDRAVQLGKRVTGQVFRGEARQSHGLRTEFGQGAMFAKADLGAHWLTGAALRNYRERAGTYGRFGFPRTDVERTDAKGVRRVVFEHGRMYRIGKRRTYTLWGRVLIRYRDLGGITGELGLPTSSMIVIPGGRKATFANGAIVWDQQADEIVVEHR